MAARVVAVVAVVAAECGLPVTATGSHGPGVQVGSRADVYAMPAAAASVEDPTRSQLEVAQVSGKPRCASNKSGESRRGLAHAAATGSREARAVQVGERDTRIRLGL